MSKLKIKKNCKTKIEDYVPNNLNNNFANKRSQSTNLTNLEIQEEINRIEECLNLPKTVCFVFVVVFFFFKQVFNQKKLI